MTIYLRVLVAVLAYCAAYSARAADDFYERPPLRWVDIEEPLRMFCEVDEGAEWTQAWPIIERAYLDFLAEEDARRTVDALPLARLYESVESGVAEERAVREYHRRWQSHLERCHAAEVTFLASLEALVPASASEAAAAIARGREIAWLSQSGITNAPQMATALRRILLADLSPDAHRLAREAVTTAERSMVEHLRALRRAGTSYRESAERQHVKTSKEAAAGDAANTEEMARSVEESLAAIERALESGGQAHAAVERVGVDALLGLVETWSLEDRRKALAALNLDSAYVPVEGLPAVRELRLRWATRRFPPSAEAKDAIAAARAAWIEASCAIAVQALRDLRDDATLVTQHMRDVHASKPSSWLEAMNEHARAREALGVKADGEFNAAVRSALGIPSDHPWPRIRREEFDDVDFAVDPHAQNKAELDGWQRGIEAFAGEMVDWSTPLPNAASLQRLAARLGVGAPVADAWIAKREELQSAGRAESARLQETLRTILRGPEPSEEAALAAWHSLRTASQRMAATLADAMRPTLAADASSQASFEVWLATTTASPAGQVARRSIHGIGARPGDATGVPIAPPMSWRDRAGNPLEALELLELPADARRTLDEVIREPATRFRQSAVGLDAAEVEASIALDVAMARYQTFFRDGSPNEERMKAWVALNARRAELVARAAAVAAPRAAAAKALCEAIAAALSDEQRAAYDLASRKTLMPGIESERPRFARVFSAAISLSEASPARDAVRQANDAWEKLWEHHTSQIASFDDGGAFRSLSRRVDLSAQERHGAAVLRWYEVRRREESIVAVRAMSRLLGAEERARLPRW